jgi:hypothetical protein
VRTFRFGIADLVQDEYPRIDFEIRLGDDSVEVVLAYDHDAAVIDLGCCAPNGWRGWSGGARDRFVITRDRATPGYLPGELESGTWYVQLGLYRMPAEPIDVTVTIRTPAVGPNGAEPEVAPRPETPRASARKLPAPAGLSWYAGDFHAHSTHSDGALSLGQLTALAVEQGLDFLAVTDHNTTSHHQLLPALGAEHDITLLPGQEVTTRRGHANAFGDIGWVDFREHPDSWVRTVAERGGMLSINHPLQDNCAWQHQLAELPPALELWHSSWFRDPTATGPWAQLRRWREDVIMIGGGDFHNLGSGLKPGTPLTWVAAQDRSPEGILDGVRAGRTMITRLGSPDAPALLRMDDDLVAVAADGTVLSDLEGRRQIVHGDFCTVPIARAGLAPYRLEAADGSILAICP